jgi:peptidyl-prolyl cis-trans isomerase C
MRKAPIWLAVAVMMASASAGRSPARADDQGAVVARVGTHQITALELARRMAAVPAFQLKTFGANADEIKKNFLQRVIIREELLAQEAENRKLAERDDVRDRIRNVLRNTMVAAEKARAAIEHPIADADIQAYYNANANKFHAPSRVSVWRIQVGTEKEASDILDEMKKDDSTKHWADLALERSLDKQTYMHNGNLGFVGPDGSTTEEGVKIEANALAAVMRAKDSQILSEPIKEGDRFDVLWRRQSMRAVDRPIELERTPIRQVLQHQRTEERLKTLVADLRKQHLTDYHPEELDALDIQPSGDLALQRRPGALGSRRAPTVAQPTPKPGPAGLR